MSKDTYVTLSEFEAKPFRDVAEIMTKRGYKMNHSHARGLLHRGLTKLATSVAYTLIGEKATPDQVDRLVRSEGFQCFVMNEIEAIDAERR